MNVNYDAILICKFLTVKHFFDNYEMKFGPLYQFYEDHY